MVQRPKIVWDPQHPHNQMNIPSAPVYYPTHAQFQDPFKFIAEIRPEAEEYGICMIVPPKTWMPPPDPLGHCEEAYEFYPKRQLVTSLGSREKGKLEESSSVSSDDEFGFIASDMPFNFHSFKAFAEWAHHLHFNKDPDGKQAQVPTTRQIEGEFWRLVESGDRTEFETFYGSDLDASRFPRAFVQAPETEGEYRADWNVATWSRSDGSVLRHLPGNEIINGFVLLPMPTPPLTECCRRDDSVGLLRKQSVCLLLAH